MLRTVPLRHLLGLAKDYKKLLVNTKQELIILRSATHYNTVCTADLHSLTMNINRIYWRIPHVTVSDTEKLKLYRFIEKDPVIHIPFRSWELYEYRTLTQTNNMSREIKTSNQMKKPRFVVVAFQTSKKNLAKEMSV